MTTSRTTTEIYADLRELRRNPQAENFEKKHAALSNEWKAAKNNEEQKIILKNHDLLKNQINNYNNLQQYTKKAIDFLISYKGDIFKANGSHTKKFNDFIQTFEKIEGFSFYLRLQQYKSSLLTDNIDLILRYKDQNLSLNFEYIKEFEPHKTTLKEVLKARKKAIALNEKIKALQSQYNTLYNIGTANYNIEQLTFSGKEFSNLI